MSNTASQPAIIPSLIGADFAAVCARYGAPLSCQYEGGVLRLTYAREGGEELDGAIQMVDGVVTEVADGIRRSPTACCGQDLIGMPVEDVLPRLGRPESISSLGESTRFEFSDRIVTVHEGTVACVVPKRPL